MNQENNQLSGEVLYTISETAALLKVNKNMVYELINKGYLRSIKFGCRKVTRKALLEFLDKFDGEELPISTGDKRHPKQQK